ncbi:MAG: hypothetical protein F6K40_26405 [Okeania sp. SIO3I5]|uniref:hypothetical protein n=1 Tax=Okeania sp. SIO3I5 TaxID=2607805 RepID=UPI0013B5FA13|nr:hypothetical protein [Okeania sp. SIO3I5]NEQ39596.1 hypothetical protein [Okeania sp. SIO3I5]
MVKLPKIKAEGRRQKSKKGLKGKGFLSNDYPGMILQSIIAIYQLSVISYQLSAWKGI